MIFFSLGATDSFFASLCFCYPLLFSLPRQGLYPTEEQIVQHELCTENFFAQKIENKNASLANLSTSSVPSLPATDITCVKEQFTGFRTLSQEQVRMLISKAAGKSCQLDPIPTPIVLKLLDVLLPVITKLINLSFDTGRFAEAWKEALVLPSLKKPGLDFAFKNFRPVSNLSYISKLSERAGAEQFMEHLTANNLHSQLQSAYKQQHSTETALLKVKNDILMSMDEQHVTFLVLLDLSAAFDTIHYGKLIVVLSLIWE